MNQTHRYINQSLKNNNYLRHFKLRFFIIEQFFIKEQTYFNFKYYLILLFDLNFSKRC